MNASSGSHRIDLLPELLGYRRTTGLVFEFEGNKEHAREAIQSGDSRKLGHGMRRGKIIANVSGDRVKISFLTIASRSWFGPIYEATLEDLGNGKVRLMGRLRLTFFEALNFIVLQFGLSLWFIEELFSGRFREYRIGIWPALGISMGVIIGLMFCPRLSWVTRKWKIDALTEHLTGLGFGIR